MGLNCGCPAGAHLADLEIAEYVLTVTHNIRENADMNADPAVKTVYYLLEEGEFLAEDTGINNNNSEINNDQSFTTENGDNIEPRTLEEDSIFNENPNENNKALTA